MQNSQNLYALLIGINKYPDNVNNLRGCVHDVLNVKNYLEDNFSNDSYALNTKMLINEEATRENIIKNFDYFMQAENGDICYLHYSGHGSRCPAPSEFADLETDGFLETLVCYDSRNPGGRDLLDKELSYLLWKVTHGKAIHFVVVMDCCHSGTNTRDSYVNSRRFDKERVDYSKVEDYLGFESYVKNSNGQYTVPRGQYVKLAAAKAKQTAKEVMASGKERGIFTYCLLDALKKARNQISYSELINRVRLRIRNKVDNQTPLLEVTNSAYENLHFLTGQPSPAIPHFWLAYDIAIKKWIVNAGAVNGIVAGTEESKTKLELLHSKKEVVIDEVFPGYSTVSFDGQLDRNKAYEVRIKSMSILPVRIAFAYGNDLSGELILKEELERRKQLGINIVKKQAVCDLLIHAKDGYFFLTKLDATAVKIETNETLSVHQIPALFKKVKGFNIEGAKEFVFNLERVVRWLQFLELRNPNTSIGEFEIEIQMARSLSPGEEHNDVLVQDIDWKGPGLFEYQQKGESWYRPAFQLKLKNKGHRTLYLSLVYFSSQFGIDNILMNRQELEPGQKVRASYVAGGTTRYTIPLQLEDQYLQWGIDKIQEYIKLIISTEDFDTSSLNQRGLSLDEFRKNPTRSLAVAEPPSQPDWTSKEIILNIHRPQKSLITS